MTIHIRGQPASVEDQLDDAWLGDSEMAVRIRGFDWSATPLGPRALAEKPALGSRDVPTFQVSDGGLLGAGSELHLQRRRA
jgi:hypothetical protein